MCKINPRQWFLLQSPCFHKSAQLVIRDNSHRTSASQLNAQNWTTRTTSKSIAVCVRAANIRGTSQLPVSRRMQLTITWTREWGYSTRCARFPLAWIDCMTCKPGKWGSGTVKHRRHNKTSTVQLTIIHGYSCVSKDLWTWPHGLLRASETRFMQI